MKSGNRKNKGQAMLLTVFVLGATLLGATTVAGLLILYQVRQGTDLTNSAKAIAAADTGIEWGIYRFTHPTSTHPVPELANGSVYSVSCYDANGTGVDCGSSSTAAIIGNGQSGSSQRALKVAF